MKRLVYLALRVFSSVDRFVRERLTPAGWTASAMAFTAALAGVDTNQTVTYQAFTLLGALLLLALGAALAFRPRALGERALPRLATAGEPFEYRVGVRNTGRRPLEGVTVREQVIDPRPAYREWLAAREPGEERRNAFDRHAGYFRWRWLIERRIPAPQAEVMLPPLAPGAQTSLRLTLTPRRRGRIELAGLRLGRTDPLGLVKGLSTVELPGHLIALPKRYRVPTLALPGARRFQQGGVSLATSIGDSEEFVALRDYRPGDPLQKLHWKSFARTGKPITKEYQDEFFERHALVLDTGRSAGEDAVFEEAVAVAASFVYTIDTQECLLDLLFVAEDVQQFTAGRGQLKADRMLEVLAAVAPSPPGAFDGLARSVLGQRGRLSSLIIVLLAWDEARSALLRALAASGMHTRALLVCDPASKPAALPFNVIALHPGDIEAGLARLQ